MRLVTLFALPLFALACRSEGETKFIPDRDGDGLNEDEDCDDADPGIGQATTYYYDNDRDGHGDAAVADGFCEQPEGYATVGDDCDDTNNLIYPGALDVCDKLDNDCDGVVDNGLESTAWYVDADEDGYGDDANVVWDCTQPDGTTELGGDCDDADAAYNPGAPEEDCEDPNDYNCDGSVGYDDTDADGFAACAECDDNNAAVNPDALEVCNGIDDDCDTLYDDEDDSLDPAAGVTVYQDLDADGYGDPGTGQLVCEAGAGWVTDATDCDDTRPDINPGAIEVCNDLDDDCDTLIDDADDSLDATTGTAFYTDADGDGYGDDALALYACDAPAGTTALGGDCNDADVAYNPGAAESDCTDPNDYNCDGSVGYVDADGDGYAACEECDDANAANNPAAVEVCDGADNDCDGAVDEADATDASTWYADTDADGYGDAGNTAVACDVPVGYTADATDCDDADGNVNPAEIELCNGIDDNCDGVIDEDTSADTLTWYADADSDGYGDAASTLDSCSAPGGYVADDDDCDDTDASINPAGTEVCDGVDNNCDGAIDEDAALDAGTWYADADGDGYGDTTAIVDCTQPADTVANDDDCDDTEATVYPGAAELCDGLDNDCDGTVDDGATTTFYADADTDGYGDAGTTVDACAAPAGYVSDDTDCDDTEATAYPGAAELCDGLDNDCDGTVDDGATTTFYADADADGYGDAGTSADACAAPSGYTSDDTDCDDTEATVYPGAAELCDGLDNDCDGTVDDGATTVFYADADGDGYGDARLTSTACAAPSGYVSNDDDCDDATASTYPGATEVCDSIDNDCDGSIDEGLATATYYADTDGDGYGDSTVTTVACSAPSGYSTTDDDCDDGDIDINPGESDVCDTLDNDCDGSRDNDGLCPCDVEEYGGSVYMYCTTAATWTVGETACLSYDYDYAAITDAAENTEVNSQAFVRYGGKWWMGFNDVATEGTWVWANGDAASYTNWASGEPNNSGSNEDCAQLGRYYPATTWNDEPCSSSFRYICEG